MILKKGQSETTLMKKGKRRKKHKTKRIYIFASKQKYCLTIGKNDPNQFGKCCQKNENFNNSEQLFCWVSQLGLFLDPCCHGPDPYKCRHL